MKLTNAKIDSNKIKDEDKAFHDWFRFVLSFPPHLVREYLDKFKADSGSTVLDPFCGTGTTLVECKKLGVNSVGIEANPFAYFASKTKLGWDIDESELKDHSRLIASHALRQLERDGISDESDLPLFTDRSADQFMLRTLPDDKARMLLKDSISPVPLHKTLVLLETLEKNKIPAYYEHQRLALAKALVFKISNLHFGPEVGVKKTKRENCPVISVWLQCINDMVADIRNKRSDPNIEANVFLGDAREPAKILKPNSIDAVITSPPYPNEKDYSRTTRLELTLLDFLANKDDLRNFKKTLVRSNTRGVYKDDDDDRFVRDFPQINKIAEDIESKRKELGKTSGFERLYSRVTKLYFGGMARHFESLRTSLKPGAMLAYVVGDQSSYLRIMIKTGELLQDIARTYSYEVIGSELFRNRLSTSTRSYLREEVILLRWNGHKK